MNYTNCCNAPFGNPGWPDCDLCSECKEHAEPMEYEEDEEDVQLGASIVKSNDEVSGVFMVDGKIKDVDYFIEKKPKRRIEIEITYEGLHCEEEESNDNPFGLKDL